MEVSAEREGEGWVAWAECWPCVRARATTLADADAEVRRQLAQYGAGRWQPLAA